MSSAPRTAERRVDIDTLRASDCIALVSYHVVGASPQSGMELGPNQWLTIINLSLIDLRISLSSFLPGMVFLTLVLDTQAWRYERKKMRQLLIAIVSVRFMF